MRWPLMFRSSHDKAMKVVLDEHDNQMRLAVVAQHNIYRRAFADATREGQSQVHLWALDVNARLFMESHPNIFRNKALAALQEAEKQFKPQPVIESTEEEPHAISG